MGNSDGEKTILVVEDEAIWRDMLEKLLHRQGFEVINAFDYTDALNKIRRLRPSPILAVVDLTLPTSDSDGASDGFHVLTSLREKGIYAVVVSSFTRKNATFLAERIEVYDTVDKVRFAAEENEENFEDAFIKKIRAAINHACLAREAEGKLPQQQKRVHSLPLLTQR